MLCAAKILAIFGEIGREVSDSQEYNSLQCMLRSRPITIVGETNGIVCQW